MTNKITRKEGSEILNIYAQAQDAGHYRAQCYNIAQKISENKNKTVAEIMLDDHDDVGHSLRHSKILVDCGLAQEIGRTDKYFGTFVYFDGSYLNSHSYGMYSDLVAGVSE